MNRVVVRAPNWLGDAVMALPAMAAVRRAFAGRTLLVAATAGIAPLFAERTDAAPDEVVAIDRDREVEQLRALRADGVILFPNSFGSAWTARRSGIRERWGYASSGRSLLLTKRATRPKGSVHQVEYYLALARGLGIDAPAPGSARPAMQPSARSRAQGEALLASAAVDPAARLVGFAPGAAYGRAKRWPPSRVAQVIEALSRDGIVSVLVGARDDRETGRAIESSLSQARVVNLIGRTTLGELVGVMSRCAAFVSNDSGSMHVAAALGVPLTAIFGPTDERATAPAGGKADVILRDVFCRPCMLRECPIDHRCMKRIEVDAVLQSVRSHINANEQRE